MLRIESVTAPSGTWILNVPSLEIEMPARDPRTLTCPDVTGPFVIESTTVPFTVRVGVDHRPLPIRIAAAANKPGVKRMRYLLRRELHGRPTASMRDGARRTATLNPRTLRWGNKVRPNIAYDVERQLAAEVAAMHAP